MYLQSIKSVKHNATVSVNRSMLKKRRHIGFGVFIVHSSMLCRILRRKMGQSFIVGLPLSGLITGIRVQMGGGGGGANKLAKKKNTFFKN
jgi:hypothetical protein